MLDSDSVIRAPELVTEAHLVNNVSVKRELFCCLGIGVEDVKTPAPGLRSNVPADLGLIFPPVELLEVSDMSGFTIESTGLLLGRITIGCS